MPTLINICGCARSGSTLLDVTLGNAPNAFSLGEVYAWFRPYRRHHYKIDCSCGQDPCPIWQKIKGFPEKSFHYQTFETLGVDFLIDSSKNLVWVMDNNQWAKRYRYRVINLLIWKDPVNLMYSHWKRGEASNAWRKDFLGYYAKFFRTNLPFLSISYTKLAADPCGYLEKICTALDMAYFPGKERFWEKTHHYLFGSGGVRQQLQQGTYHPIHDEICPPEFLQAEQRELQELEHDAEVGGLVSKLEATEISNFAASDLEKTITSPTHIRHPLWYYLFKLRRYYRRLFPQPYHYPL